VVLVARALLQALKAQLVIPQKLVAEVAEVVRVLVQLVAQVVPAASQVVEAVAVVGALIPAVLGVLVGPDE
jgi:phage-related protein